MVTSFPVRLKDILCRHDAQLLGKPEPFVVHLGAHFFGTGIHGVHRDALRLWDFFPGRYRKVDFRLLFRCGPFKGPMALRDEPIRANLKRGAPLLIMNDERRVVIALDFITPLGVDFDRCAELIEAHLSADGYVVDAHSVFSLASWAAHQSTTRASCGSLAQAPEWQHTTSSCRSAGQPKGRVDDMENSMLLFWKVRKKSPLAYLVPRSAPDNCNQDNEGHSSYSCVPLLGTL